MPPIELTPIGTVSSSADISVIDVHERFAEGLHRIGERQRLAILYWMHKLDPEERDLLQVYPRGDRTRGLWGVFALRSPMRPNPIGVTDVELVSREGNRLFVRGLDAFEGAPVIDIKVAAVNG